VFHGQAEVCNGKDDNCNGQVDEENAAACVPPDNPTSWKGGYALFYFDGDGDGYGSTSVAARCLCNPDGKYTTTTGGDCDDTNPAVNPGAQEDCSTPYDDNCNGSTNDVGAAHCKPYYVDVDGDGYGDPNHQECLCTATSAYTVSKGGDCNDNDASIHPDQPENCNTPADDNCNGTNNDTYNLINGRTFYKDVDGDGFGINDSVTMCYPVPASAWADHTQPPPANLYYSADASSTVWNPWFVQGKYDCNDNDASIHPGPLTSEICGNGKDDNCDGLTDSGWDPINKIGPTGCLTYYRDNDRDGYGETSDWECLCPTAATAPYDTRLSGDCNDVPPAGVNINPGEKEVCNGIDDDCDGLTDNGPAAQLCPPGDNATFVCTAGACAVSTCSPGYYDLDHVATNGCECTDSLEVNSDNTCSTATDLGTLTEGGTLAYRVGAIIPQGDTDWYKVHVVDSPDSGTVSVPGHDQFNLHVEVVPAPGAPAGAFVVNVIRVATGAACTSAQTACATPQPAYTWFTNFSNTSAFPNAGEDPCYTYTNPLSTSGDLYKCGSDPALPTGTINCTTGNPYLNTHYCLDDSADFYIVVSWTTNANVAYVTNCDYAQYTLQLSD
jgi:hypothetical protein